MTVDILQAPSYYPMRSGEIDGVKIWIVGTLHEYRGNPCAALYQIFTKQGDLKPIEELLIHLRELQGNFSCIIQDQNNNVLAATDKIRSYPVFYSQRETSLCISVDPCAIQARLPSCTRNQNAFLEFTMAGYVTLGDTLFHEIRQLQAGEFLLCDGRESKVNEYYTFYNPGSATKTREELIQEVHETTKHIFKRLIERLNGRPVFVPLSGGLDSRLVLCMLKELGYDHIQAFSYGVPGNCEAAAARLIAERIGVSWFFVPYTRAFGRRTFYTPEREKYFRFAHEMTGIPMMTDFYALHYLSEQGRISKDAVIINGQTGDFISGGHIPASCNYQDITEDMVLDAIIAKHYSLWTHIQTPLNTETIKDRIRGMVGSQLTHHMSQEVTIKVYELWEWRARQAQHVVAGQRVYDFFGLAWELPLWDDEYLRFWSQIPFVYKFKQVLYRGYLEQYDFYGVFRMKFQRYTPPRWAHWLENAFVVFGPKREEYRRIFLQYWQKYAFFYAKDSYPTYIKYARYHRNPSSVLAQYVLQDEYQEHIP